MSALMIGWGVFWLILWLILFGLFARGVKGIKNGTLITSTSLEDAKNLVVGSAAGVIISAAWVIAWLIAYML